MLPDEERKRSIYQVIPVTQIYVVFLVHHFIQEQKEGMNYTMSPLHNFKYIYKLFIAVSLIKFQLLILCFCDISEEYMILMLLLFVARDMATSKSSRQILTVKCLFLI
jgi:hypothetical protein